MRKKLQWLPERKLEALKEIRERCTYHTYELGGTDFAWSLDTFSSCIGEHLLFQKKVLRLVLEFVQDLDEPEERVFRPSLRVGPLQRRFSEYERFCEETGLA